MPQVTLQPSGHGFPADTHETVLEAALRHGVCLPYGCRNGACGACKGKVLAGEVDFGPHQAATLTEDEKRAGFALFCCATPRSDLVIEVREVRRAGDIQVRRLPVLNRDKRLIGIVSLADLVASGHTAKAGEALGGIVRPGGEHSQSIH